MTLQQCMDDMEDYKRRLKLLAERLTQEGKTDMLSKVIRNDELFEILCKEYGIE